MNKQFFLFFAAIALGILGGLVYGIIVIFRKYVEHSLIGIYIEDIIYWLIFAIAVFLTMLYYNYGEIRPYIFMGIFMGMIIYAVLLHRLFVKLISPIIALLRLFAEIMLTPFMVIAFPFKKIYIYFKKSLKKSPKYEKMRCMLKQNNRFLKKR